MATPTIYRGGGAFMTVGHGYHVHLYLLVLNKTRQRYSYRCVHMKPDNKDYPGYMEKINKEISKQNSENFEMIYMMPCSSMDSEISSSGTKFIVGIFMKKHTKRKEDNK